MLRNLLFRDWTLNRLHVFLVMAMAAGFQIYLVLRIDSARMWMVATAVFMAFQTIVPFTREDKFQSAGWVCTLPVRRREIVKARWAAAWLYILAGLLIAFGMAALLPGSRALLARALIPDTMLLAAGIASVILALLLPFTIRYGITGVMIFMVVAQVAGGVALVAAMMSRGRKGGVSGALHAVIEGTRSGLLSLQAALGPIVFQAAAVAALVLINWLGYRLALALYRRREF